MKLREAKTSLKIGFSFRLLIRLLSVVVVCRLHDVAGLFDSERLINLRYGNLKLSLSLYGGLAHGNNKCLQKTRLRVGSFGFLWRDAQLVGQRGVNGFFESVLASFSSIVPSLYPAKEGFAVQKINFQKMPSFVGKPFLFM